MGKVFVIPDVHLKPWMFEKAGELVTSAHYDAVVLLGDLVDDWGQEKNIGLYNETFKAAISFVEKHPNTFWCYGNHDMSYVWEAQETGYSFYARETVVERTRDLKNVLSPKNSAYIHRIENILFSHAGLTESFACRHFGDGESLDFMVAKINEMGEAEMWTEDSPIWARPQYGGMKAYSDGIFQVAGHTPVERPILEDCFLTLDTFSTYQNGTPIGDERFVWVDTEVGGWGYVEDEPEVSTIIFPSSYFNTKKVDEDLRGEYEAAVETSLWDTIFFNYDKWFNEGELVLSEKPDVPICAVHRGWMMKAEQYRDFYDALLGEEIKLVTSPGEYERFHYFPNVYRHISEDTPRTIIVPNGSTYAPTTIKEELGRFMVKDYVKSVKGTDFPKYFTKDTTDEEFFEAMKLFYQYRGDLLSGGLCFKEYVDLKTYGDKTNEYRVFYVNNEVLTVCRNSLQPGYTPEPPKDLIEKYKGLGSCFYTLDYAELADGSWKILEAGDGSVSGPSEGQDLRAFYRTLHYGFRTE